MNRSADEDAEIKKKMEALNIFQSMCLGFLSYGDPC